VNERARRSLRSSRSRPRSRTHPQLGRIAACIAVDWSGAIAGVRSRLWLAEARERRLVRVERGFDRAEVVRHLIECARREPRLVVGLDFAFSFPRWFVDELGLRNARELWDRVAQDGEDWLARCPPPFWGKPFVPRPPPREGRSEWRSTENANLLVGGIGPKSIFQIGGAGSVGTGSLRGMPYLRELRAAGFAIWPFDRPHLPLVVEIYPRYLTGKVEKSSAVARALYLEARLAHEPRELVALAASSEDAFDEIGRASCRERVS
jgi:hypothetical protein